MALAGAVTLFALMAADPTYFGDIRPLFERSCFGCHAAGVKMGSLDLETWAGVERGGNNGTILVPGKPAESRLYTMLRGEAAPAMPMDGKVLPPAQIEAVRLWIASGARLGDVSSPPALGRIYSMALAGDELAFGRFGSVEVAGRRLAGLAGPVRALAVSREGRIAAAADTVGVFDRTDALTKITAGAVEAVAFSRDGQLLATGDGAGRIALWDAANGRRVRAFEESGAVAGLAFTAKGELVAGGAGRFIQVWNASTGASVRRLDVGPEGVTALAVAADGAIAAAGADRRIRIWREGKLVAERLAHEDRVLRLAWSGDGARLASASADGALKISRASDLREVRTLGAQSDWVVGLEFLASGALAVARFDGTWERIDAR